MQTFISHIIPHSACTAHATFRASRRRPGSHIRKLATCVHGQSCTSATVRGGPPPDKWNFYGKRARRATLHTLHTRTQLHALLNMCIRLYVCVCFRNGSSNRRPTATAPTAAHKTHHCQPPTTPNPPPPQKSRPQPTQTLRQVLRLTHRPSSRLLMQQCAAAAGVVLPLVRRKRTRALLVQTFRACMRILRIALSHTPNTNTEIETSSSSSSTTSKTSIGISGSALPLWLSKAPRLADAVCPHANAQKYASFSVAGAHRTPQTHTQAKHSFSQMRILCVCVWNV